MSRNRMTWSQAFLMQAREDFDAAFQLLESHRDGSTFFMLLQMCFEKLAKAAAFQTLSNDRMPPKVHDVIPLFQGMLCGEMPMLKAFIHGIRMQWIFLWIKLPCSNPVW